MVELFDERLGSLGDVRLKSSRIRGVLDVEEKVAAWVSDKMLMRRRRMTVMLMETTRGVALGLMAGRTGSTQEVTLDTNNNCSQQSTFDLRE